MHNPKWALFYDFHTMPACPDVGATFDAGAFADRMKDCGVDYCVFHARCNLGMAYYDTQVGIKHPSLQRDLFGELAQACQERGIALSAYFNVGLSHEEALLHRDWAIVTQEGYVYQPDRLNHFFRGMCYNTGYAEHLLEMIREVVTGYPVAGLFLDCMTLPPCVGVECIREMKERGMDWEHPDQLAEFARISRNRMAQRIADTARALNPDLLLYFNGVQYEDQAESGNYLEFECLPTGGWGYEPLPLYGRFMRNLGKPVLNMTGRFHRSWGDFGGIRTQPSLEYDVYHGLALGLRTTIGDHFHPRGDLNHAVFDLIEHVYTEAQRLEPWLEEAQPLSDLAMIAPEPGFQYVHVAPHLEAQNIMYGAARMLGELKQQFDVLSTSPSWEKYKLLVLPDLAVLDETAAERIRKHLAGGGAILSSGWSGLNPEKSKFVCDEWGLTYTGEDPYDPAFILPGPELLAGMPDMPITLYERGIAMEAAEGTQVLARIMAPYYNRHWDGEHGFLYLPPATLTERPAVTLRGQVAHISHPVFKAYFNFAPVPMKQIVANLLAKLLPQPLLRVPTMPSFARATVTSQPGRRMVHLLSYVPEQRGSSTQMIEEPVELREVPVALRLDGRTPQKVYMAPEGQELAFQIEGEYAMTTVPVVPGHAMVVFEE
ncbi:MAG: hypothetical protein GX100_12745 [candidate division WS1 bacterium]|nr:hypothetical protein [candidate division WS1 bacterium]